ncbi:MULTISPECIES: transcription termination/antitermination protein NusG [Aquirufa]|jgi:transcriptional antiterminator NusG|uniref:Transcription termination/antitermination protein NusG n=2 Tax=Aquirufa TaxID=2676247 RepID=A0A4Q9BDW4_9BACT|nr:transcription termination/antitermination protein NusG [Aquirufa antheringensis]MCE4217402.1 transcription termination/antitermination factor NusG [Pseudarcicella sp. GAP-15]MCZ2478645.1 transcription termination/antitermination factor NusG [Aquirufa antheringensis]MCZ2484654.1 transcription termination/antitermination factor NusG [Aquirufa antheringensis]MCZ2487478.1 transcription termination/antitermination factor NusG [Aquirufa antheringensis]MCZ2489697.1 transcription termination/antite
MAETKWYVLRAISGQEKKVKTYMENELARQGVLDSVPQILIPTEKIYEIRKGKKVIREKNLFPGYILVEADLAGEVSHILTSTPGVIGFLQANNEEVEVTKVEGGKVKKTKVIVKKPVPINQSEVNRILGKVDESAAVEEFASVTFIKGETVRVIDGPFATFEGTVEEIHENTKKLSVMVKIFGRNTPLELNYAQVEK